MFQFQATQNKFFVDIFSLLFFRCLLSCETHSKFWHGKEEKWNEIGARLAQKLELATTESYFFFHPSSISPLERLHMLVAQLFVSPFVRCSFIHNFLVFFFLSFCPEEN